METHNTDQNGAVQTGGPKESTAEGSAFCAEKEGGCGWATSAGVETGVENIAEDIQNECTGIIHASHATPNTQSSAEVDTQGVDTSGGEGLVVRESLLKGAGLGLFVTHTFQIGDVVCEYKPKLQPALATKDALRLQDKSYLMRLGPQTYIDLREEMDVLARYINDCRNYNHYNVTFEKRPEEGRALVVAIKELKAGDEVYVDYGKWYWASWKERPARLPG